MAKNLALDLILAYLAQIQATNFFFKNLASSVPRFHDRYRHVQYQKKLIIQSWENLVTHRRTNGREWFIGLCTTNAKCPIKSGVTNFTSQRNFKQTFECLLFYEHSNIEENGEWIRLLNKFCWLKMQAKFLAITIWKYSFVNFISIFSSFQCLFIARIEWDIVFLVLMVDEMSLDTLCDVQEKVLILS